MCALTSTLPSINEQLRQSTSNCGYDRPLQNRQHVEKGVSVDHSHTFNPLISPQERRGDKEGGGRVRLAKGLAREWLANVPTANTPWTLQINVDLSRKVLEWQNLTLVSTSVDQVSGGFGVHQDTT